MKVFSKKQKEEKVDENKALTLYTKTFNLSIFGAIITGVNGFTKPNYKITHLTRFCWVLISITFIFSFLTVFKKMDEDPMFIFEGCCMLGSAVQTVARQYICIKYSDKFYYFHTRFLDLYKEYGSIKSRYANHFETAANYSWLGFKISIIVYFVAGSIVAFSPFLIYLYNGATIFIMQFEMPYIDVETTMGYCITLFVQGTIFCIGVCQVHANDIIFVIHVIHLVMIKNIVRQKFRELNEAIETNQKHETESLVKDIVRWHQMFCEFSSSMQDMYQNFLVSQIFACAFTLCLNVYMILYSDWPASYVYLLAYFNMLYAYCLLGTVAEIAHEEFFTMIYNECAWYRLTIKEQRILLFMMLRTENHTSFSVGGIQSLSVNLALQVTKSIYSFAMIILQMADEIQ